MKNPPDFITYLGGLIAKAAKLVYQDPYGKTIKVRIQKLADLNKVNAKPENIRKLAECGVENAVLIGSDELGVPILLDCGTLKTYLLDPESVGQEYLKHQITITHD